MKKYVMILDTHRGIYAGRLVSTTNAGRTVKLSRGRHCYQFLITPNLAERGVYALAVSGPASGSRVGPPVTMTIHDVAKIVDCEPAAVAAWEGATWG